MNKRGGVCGAPLGKNTPKKANILISLYLIKVTVFKRLKSQSNMPKLGTSKYANLYAAKC